MTFAQFQPIYAAHGIATVPLREQGKVPAMRSPQCVGLEGSAKLASNPKFADCNVGFFAGPRSKITVLDIDSTDECVLEDAIYQHGPTPLIVRTASRKWHCYYRHNGERRRIRPERGVAIDIIGAGLAVAPPSEIKGGAYEIIQGSLDDLDRLPVMRGVEDFARIARGSKARTELQAWSKMRAGDGRNRALFLECMRQARHCDDYGALLDVATTINNDMLEPMSDAEVARAATSAWGYEERGQNWCGIGKAVVTTHDEIDGLLMQAPDAFLLLQVLRRHHWGREFCIANDMHRMMGWRRQRFTAARRRLIDEGLIIETRPANHWHPAQYRWPGPGGH
jgi:Bifunctional DNA primase/polymerase, N-terminal